MSVASRAGLVAVPCVPGMRRPTSWGHRFGPDLRCSLCHVTWGGHQNEPRPCPRVGASHAVGETEERAARERGASSLALAARN